LSAVPPIAKIGEDLDAKERIYLNKYVNKVASQPIVLLCPTVELSCECVRVQIYRIWSQISNTGTFVLTSRLLLFQIKSSIPIMAESSTHGSLLSGQTATPSTEGRWRNNFTVWFKGEFKGETRVGFWHPELRTIRARVGKEWAQTSMLSHQYR
jgi:hypothetical protein